MTKLVLDIFERRNALADVPLCDKRYEEETGR